MDKCERCQNKEATLQCMNCCSFRNLCQGCDSFIHSLPTKKNHSRIPIGSILSGEQTRIPSQFLSGENTERLINEQRENCCNEHENILENKQLENPNININDNKILNSNINPCNSQFQSNSNLNFVQNTFSNENNNNNNQNLNNELPENFKVERINSPNQQNTFSTQPNSTVLNSKLYFAENYSKDYVNELKNIFRKEKEQLEFKNKTLQNNLDSLKFKFAEQMNDLSKQLEDIQRNNNITLDNLKNNYEQKLIELNNEHQIEVESLKNDIDNLEEKEKELNDKYEKELSEKDKIILNLNNKIEELQNNLSEKTEENYRMKNSFDLMTQQYEQKFNDDKNKLIKDYEDKINNIVDNVECTKNKLLKLVDDREFDIKNILDTKKTELFKLNEENEKLKEEIECHKLNVIRMRDERDYLANQNEQLKKNENQYQCNSQIQNNEINQLNEEIRKLCEENDDLKCQITKLDKIIYGKIRPTINPYTQKNC